MIKTLDGCSLRLVDQKTTKMSHKFLFYATFHTILITIDREIAEDVRQKGCSCGGCTKQTILEAHWVCHLHYDRLMKNVLVFVEGDGYTPNNPTYNKIHKNQIIASHQGLH